MSELRGPSSLEVRVVHPLSRPIAGHFRHYGRNAPGLLRGILLVLVYNLIRGKIRGIDLLNGHAQIEMEKTGNKTKACEKNSNNNKQNKTKTKTKKNNKHNVFGVLISMIG